MPSRVSSSYSPSTTCQRNSPVLRSIAVNCPHGGCWQGYRLESQKRPCGPDRLRQGTSESSPLGSMLASEPTSIELM